jgi:hypothetical protein
MEGCQYIPRPRMRHGCVRKNLLAEALLLIGDLGLEDRTVIGSDAVEGYLTSGCAEQVSE